MSVTTSISELSRQQMLSILGQRKSGQNAATGLAASGTQQSPFAQMLTQLQQVEQSNPADYSKLTQQISTNLAAASSTAQIRGNSTLAAQLTTLSKDFATASQSGQLPNVTDLASAMTASSSTPVVTASSPTAPRMNPLQIIGNVIGSITGL